MTFVSSSRSLRSLRTGWSRLIEQRLVTRYLWNIYLSLAGWRTILPSIAFRRWLTITNWNAGQKWRRPVAFSETCTDRRRNWSNSTWQLDSDLSRALVIVQAARHASHIDCICLCNSSSTQSCRWMNNYGFVHNCSTKSLQTVDHPSDRSNVCQRSDKVLRHAKINSTEQDREEAGALGHTIQKRLPMEVFIFVNVHSLQSWQVRFFCAYAVARTCDECSKISGWWNRILLVSRIAPKRRKCLIVVL